MPHGSLRNADVQSRRPLTAWQFLETSLDCSSCDGLERETVSWAKDDLANYRAGKLAKTTPMLIRALLDMGVGGRTLLDIGGGGGGVQLALLRAGASRATSVEASSAYL